MKGLASRLCTDQIDAHRCDRASRCKHPSRDSVVNRSAGAAAVFKQAIYLSRYSCGLVFMRQTSSNRSSRADRSAAADGEICGSRACRLRAQPHAGLSYCLPYYRFLHRAEASERHTGANGPHHQLNPAGPRHQRATRCSQHARAPACCCVLCSEAVQRRVVRKAI
jgi:hypothetical protein